MPEELYLYFDCPTGSRPQLNWMYFGANLLESQATQVDEPAADTVTYAYQIRLECETQVQHTPENLVVVRGELPEPSGGLLAGVVLLTILWRKHGPRDCD